jgi:hypothetical protein
MIRAGGALVSHDIGTIPQHLSEFVRENTSSAVIIIPQRMSIGRAIENLLLICEVYGPSDIADRICPFPSLVLYGSEGIGA